MKRVTRHLWLLLLILYLGQSGAIPTAFSQSGELTPKGTTFNRAQVTTWLDVNRFVVTRWDGTLCVFRPPNSAGEFGPVLTQVLMAPSAKAAEMAAPISQQVFVSSNDSDSLAVWMNKDSKYVLAGTPRYDPKYGTANSATLLQKAGRQWLVTGHSEGYVIIWEVTGLHLTMRQAVLMRSPDPIPSPFKLWNVRSVVVWKNATVVTGAEDGDICLVSVPDGKILARKRFNPTAQRGINSLSICGDYLILGNCSVGPSDKNLWLYKLADNQISLMDSLNLVKDTSLPQVFNFSVQLAPLDNSLYFFAGTQEGILWMGHIVKDKLVTLTNAKVSYDGGAAIAFQPKPWLLSVVAFDISLYTVSSKPQ